MGRYGVANHRAGVRTMEPRESQWYVGGCSTSRFVPFPDRMERCLAEVMELAQ